MIPSTTIDNNKGDKGNPYLSPFDGINNSDVDPLMKTVNDTDDKKFII